MNTIKYRVAAFLLTVILCSGARCAELEIAGRVIDYRLDEYTETESIISESSPKVRFDMAYVLLEKPAAISGTLIPLIVHRSDPVSDLLKKLPLVIFAIDASIISGSENILAIDVGEMHGIRIYDGHELRTTDDREIIENLVRRLPHVTKFSGSVLEISQVAKNGSASDEEYVMVLAVSKDKSGKKVRVRLEDSKQLRFLKRVLKDKLIAETTIEFLTYDILLEKKPDDCVVELRARNLFQIKLDRAPKSQSKG